MFVFVVWITLELAFFEARFRNGEHFMVRRNAVRAWPVFDGMVRVCSWYCTWNANAYRSVILSHAFLLLARVGFYSIRSKDT